MPDRVIENCRILISDGLISKVTGCEEIGADRETTIIDAAGKYIFPGFVDLHCDAIEKEIEPRPNTLFPTGISFRELEKKLAGQGVTTVFHSISFAEGELGLRSNAMAARIIKQIKKDTAQYSLIRNRIHVRFEISNMSAGEMIAALIRRRVFDLLSFMDHTPGRGQYQKVEDYRAYLANTYRMSSGSIDEILARLGPDSGRGSFCCVKGLSGRFHAGTETEIYEILSRSAGSSQNNGGTGGFDLSIYLYMYTTGPAP